MKVTAADLAQFRAAKSAGQVPAPRVAAQTGTWLRSITRAAALMAPPLTAAQATPGPRATAARAIQHGLVLLADAAGLLEEGQSPERVLALLDHRLSELTDHLSPAPEAPTMPTSTLTELERCWQHVCGDWMTEIPPAPGEMLAQLRAWVRERYPEAVRQAAEHRMSARLEPARGAA